MTMMTAEKSTEEMTDPGRGVIASAITTIRLAIAPLIPTMAFFLESSSDDDDQGWTKVSYRRSKSRSH